MVCVMFRKEYGASSHAMPKPVSDLAAASNKKKEQLERQEELLAASREMRRSVELIGQKMDDMNDRMDASDLEELKDKELSLEEKIITLEDSGGGERLIELYRRRLESVQDAVRNFENERQKKRQKK